MRGLSGQYFERSVRGYWRADPSPLTPLPQGERGTRGFTLLELLIGLAMVVILAEALYASLYVGFKAQETGTKAIEPVQKLATAFTLLSQDFDGVLPPTGILAAAFTGTPADGSGSSGSGSGSSGLSAAKLNGASASGELHAPSSDGGAQLLLAFYSSSNNPLDGETGADIRKIELSIELPDGDTKQALVRRVYTNLMPSKEPEPRVQVLVRDVRNFYLRYYDGTVWNDSWDSTSLNNTLPCAVEVTLEVGLGDAQPGDDSPSTYKMTRVFALQCGISALAASNAASSSGSTSGSSTGGGN